MQAVGHFVQQVSVRVQNPLHSFSHLIEEVAKVQIDDTMRDRNGNKLNGKHQQNNEAIKQLPQFEKNLMKVENNRRHTNKVSIGFADFINRSVQTIIIKQQKAAEQLIGKLPLLQENTNVNYSQRQPIKNKQLKSILQENTNVNNSQRLLIKNKQLKNQTQTNKKTAQNTDTNSTIDNRLTFGQFMSQSLELITQKQSEAIKSMIQRLQGLQEDKTSDSQPQLNNKKPQTQLSGEQLQRLSRNTNNQEKYPEPKLSQHNLLQRHQNQQFIDNFSFAHPSSPSKVQQAQQYCHQLRQQYFNQTLYSKATLTAFTHQIAQTQHNNSYRCIQSAFDHLKALYHANQLKSIRKNSSNRNLQSGADFNLELTMRSKLSKQSGTNIDRQDSLIYSNATSFGLQINARSKQVSRQNSSTRLMKVKDQFDQIMNIEKTSSKGEVENTENEFSVNSLSDTEPLVKKLPKNAPSRNTLNHSDQSRKSKSSRQAIVPQTENNFIANQPTAYINQQDDYQILPLTQQPPQSNPQRANMNTFGIQTPQKPIKKSFSIKTYSNKKMNNLSSTHKKSEESVFSVEISQLQSRISKIKETKLLRKLKLEQELKKVNIEIQELKHQQFQQQHTQQSHEKHKSSHINSKQQSAFQSRIMISDDLQQKKKAVQLVKGLRQQKQSRQNLKRNQQKAFNADLHQQMQDIMRMKYFHEQRIKQKRQLEIIERMKQQQVRKIVEQKQKQESVVFLSKLKNDAGHERTERKDSRVQLLGQSNKKVEASSKKVVQINKKVVESPLKKTQEKEIGALSNAALEKKKMYMKKMRNFTIIKKGQDDLFEYALN